MFSSAKSAYIYFSRPLSSSSCLMRFNSDASIPLHFDFHLKYVAVETPASQQTSASVLPFLACFSIEMICCSLNVLLVISRTSVPILSPHRKSPL